MLHLQPIATHPCCHATNWFDTPLIIPYRLPAPYSTSCVQPLTSLGLQACWCWDVAIFLRFFFYVLLLFLPFNFASPLLAIVCPCHHCYLSAITTVFPPALLSFHHHHLLPLLPSPCLVKPSSYHIDNTLASSLLLFFIFLCVLAT